MLCCTCTDTTIDDPPPPTRRSSCRDRYYVRCAETGKKTGALLRGHLLQPSVRAVRGVPAARGDGEARRYLRGVERELGEVEVRAALEVRAVQLHGRLEHL